MAFSTPVSFGRAAVGVVFRVMTSCGIRFEVPRRESWREPMIRKGDGLGRCDMALRRARSWARAWAVRVVCSRCGMGWGGRVFIGGEDPAFGFWGAGAGAVDVCCCEGGGWWGGGGREGGEGVGGGGGGVELDAAEEGEREGEVGEEVGGECLERGGVVVGLEELEGHEDTGVD